MASELIYSPYFPFLIILFLIIGLFLFIFWIVMLVDAIQRKFKGPNDKLVWVLVLIFTQLIGAVIYYFVVYSKPNIGKKVKR